MKKWFIILLIAFASPLIIKAQDNQANQMEIMMKMFGLKSSLIAKDSVALSDLLADDVTYGHSSGLIQSKAQLIRSVMTKEQDYKTIDPSDMKVRIYDNTAVVTMKAKVDMIYEGKPLKMDMAITLVWIKNKTGWKLVARQGVKL